MNGKIFLDHLFIYPVKGFRGCEVKSATLDRCGLVGDRRFLVVDPSGKFLTQRTLPKMALIVPEVSDGELKLRAPTKVNIAVPAASDPTATTIKVSVWKSEGMVAEDCGEAVADWLRDFLGVPCRLVRAGKDFVRPLLKPGKSRPGDVFTFADGYPFMGISKSSLDDLNDRLVGIGETPLHMNRFRPNFIFRGCDPYAEDTWARLQINGAKFRAGGPCARCIVITTDQETTERGKEPLRLLATYRRNGEDNTYVNFGQNLIHETFSGEVVAGSEVVVE